LQSTLQFHRHVYRYFSNLDMSWRIPFKVIQLVADLKFNGHSNAIFQDILSLLSCYT
jgi:hypothetical protein